MATIPLHPNASSSQDAPAKSPLPQLLQTPSGLALLELQGTINLPKHDDEDSPMSTEAHGGTASQETPIGRLVFGNYDTQDPNSTAWMKRVYLYVGRHQRLSGEVKKLPKAIAVIRRRVNGQPRREDQEDDNALDGDVPDELEIVEIVKWKIIFSTRPEPVGTLPTTVSAAEA